MAYVAIRGGEQAIDEAAAALEFLRTRHGGAPIDCAAIEQQLHQLHGRVLSEGGVYHPQLAALAIKQCSGCPLESAFHLRAWRATRPRLADTPTHSGQHMRLIRRISAAFKDVPGGQHLGATRDFAHRLLRYELLDESPAAFQAATSTWLGDLVDPETYRDVPSVITGLREQGLLAPAASEPREPHDITREPLVFPVHRSAALATLARGETGGVLALAYSVMRGYGDIHPTVAELRVGYVPILLPHPITGEPIEAGEVLMTECQVVAMYEAPDDPDAPPTFGLGYGACFGHNETKAIAAAVLDRSLQLGQQFGPQHPAEQQEYVLLHVDGIDSMGFCNHYKMPHYVTFQSDLDRLRETHSKQQPANAKQAAADDLAATEVAT